MNNKLSTAYLILIIPSFFPGCGGYAKEENKNNALASSVSLGHAAGEKYIIDTKESILTLEGSMEFCFKEEHKRIRPYI